MKNIYKGLFKVNKTEELMVYAEEISELTIAISEYRIKENKENKKNLIEEIADTLIVIDSIITVYDFNIDRISYDILSMNYIQILPNLVKCISKYERNKNSKTKKHFIDAIIETLKLTKFLIELYNINYKDIHDMIDYKENKLIDYYEHLKQESVKNEIKERCLNLIKK